ncbi:MAG: DUF1177 domain-containing protein [Candidatus Aminicenantaceae bacterium]
MALKQVMEVYDLLDNPKITASEVKEFLLQHGLKNDEVQTKRITGEKGSTEFIKITLQVKKKNTGKGKYPTLGIIGRLGGIGARPHTTGLVSDADGALTALAISYKLVEMRRRGDILKGDVIISTHISPSSPIIPHDPVPFMDSPVSMEIMNREEVDQAMDAILSIDTTKGNRIINHKGFAISPTVKDGYILRVSEDLLDIMQTVTGRLPAVFTITTQDIIPYGNDIYHLNSIMQPSTDTHAPVVGIALTTEVAIPGCATGANQCLDIEMAVRFCLEVAKAFGEGKCAFYDEKEFNLLKELYGSMEHLKTKRT